MRYVVGMTASQQGRAALRWAVRTAAVTGASIDAVTAFRIPMGWTPEHGERPVDDPASLRTAAHLAQAEVLRRAIGLERLGIDLTPVVRNGDPVEVLLEQARGADLIVLGLAARSVLHLRPDVGRRVAKRASCPLVLVKPGDDIWIAGRAPRVARHTAEPTGVAA